jgi:hypothetical protein
MKRTLVAKGIQGKVRVWVVGKMRVRERGEKFVMIER